MGGGGVPRLRRGGAAGVPPAALASFARRRRPPTEAICGHNPPSFPIREYLSSREKPSPLTKPLLGPPLRFPSQKTSLSPPHKLFPPSLGVRSPLPGYKYFLTEKLEGSAPEKAKSQTKPPRTLPFCRIFAPKTNPLNHCLCNKKVVLYSSIDIHIYRRSLGRTENSGCHGFLPTYKGGRPAILSPFSDKEALRQKDGVRALSPVVAQI